jgi:hypothetical protein
MAGCEAIFEEYASGGDRARPQLAAALARVTRGDTLVVARIDRLARSLSHLLAVVESLRARGRVGATPGCGTKIRWCLASLWHHGTQPDWRARRRSLRTNR